MTYTQQDELCTFCNREFSPEQLAEVDGCLICVECQEIHCVQEGEEDAAYPPQQQQAAPVGLSEFAKMAISLDMILVVAMALIGGYAMSNLQKADQASAEGLASAGILMTLVLGLAAVRLFANYSMLIMRRSGVYLAWLGVILQALFIFVVVSNNIGPWVVIAIISGAQLALYVSGIITAAKAIDAKAKAAPAT